MSRFVTATRYSRDRNARRSIVINLDQVRHMYRNEDDSFTFVQFDDNDKIQVEEAPLTLLGPGK